MSSIRLYTYLYVDLSEAVDVYSDWIDACEQANAWPHPLMSTHNTAPVSKSGHPYSLSLIQLNTRYFLQFIFLFW